MHASATLSFFRDEERRGSCSIFKTLSSSLESETLPLSKNPSDDFTSRKVLHNHSQSIDEDVTHSTGIADE